MNINTLKAKFKQMQDQVVDFVRNHEEDLKVLGAITLATVVVGVVGVLLSQPGDEESENVYNNNFDFNSDGEIDESRDSQTDLHKDPPKRSIGGIDITGTRLKANEKQFLEAFSAQYDRFKGLEQTLESKSDGWSSDGRYTRYTRTKHSFGVDKMSITVEVSYEDDEYDYEGSRSSSHVELKARNIINYVRGNSSLKMFDGVRDIVDLL